MENRKSMKKGYLIFLGIIVFVKIVSMFPMIQYNDKSIWMFAPERIGSFFPGNFTGKVLGDHVLETEYGEITLKNFATVFSGENTVIMVLASESAEGLISHNLVVEGIKIPQNIDIVFDRNTRKITLLDITQPKEVVISDIPLIVGQLFLGYSNSTADIVVQFSGAPEYIRLADSTEIHIDASKWAWGGLYIYKDTDVWEMVYKYASHLPVKLPGEDDFTAYETITFRPNWGEFIEGELFVEKDPEAERKKSEAMLKHLQDAALFGYWD